MTVDSGTYDELVSFAFALHSNPGSYALLLGAGVSMLSVPGAYQVLMNLVSDIAASKGVTDVVDPAQWYADTYSMEPRYDEVLEKIAPRKLERQQVLRPFFETVNPEEDTDAKRPTPAHQAIARLVNNGSVRVIVTLNFDHLIETALRDEGLQPTVLSTPSQIRGMAPLHTLRCCVIHLHGQYLEPASLRNTGAELAQYDPATKKLMERVLQDYGLLVAGWSAQWDPGLRDLIDRHYPDRYTLGWVQPGPVTGPAADLLHRKRGSFIGTTADDAFGHLADAVDAMRARRARDPLTVAIAAASAKRALGGGKVAIALHDTVKFELQQLHASPELNLPADQLSDPNGEHEQPRARIEEQARVSCALLAVLAHWGSEETDRWWVAEPAKFAEGTASIEGPSRLIRLPETTGAALFYAAGIAATAAQRWDLLFELFRQPVRIRERPEDGRLVHLSADQWSDDVTGLHRYLHPILSEALALGAEALDDAWQRFEVLRAAQQLLTHPGFADAVSSLLHSQLEAERTQEEADRPGTAIDLDTVHPKARASEDALIRLAGLVHIGAPHIFATRFNDNAGPFTAPAVTALAHALNDAIHSLITASKHTSPELLAATQAVGRAVTRAAPDAAYRGAAQQCAGSDGPIVVPTEVWLDTERPMSSVLD